MLISLEKHSLDCFELSKVFDTESKLLSKDRKAWVSPRGIIEADESNLNWAFPFYKMRCVP